MKSADAALRGLVPALPEGEDRLRAAARVYARGDARWFTELYAEVHRPLWAYVYRCASGDANLADDVVQETFARFLQAPRRVRERGAPEPYLYRIATNLVRDDWRRRARDARLALEEAHRGPGQRAPGHARPATRSLERTHELETVFQRLRPRERALLWLAHVDGYSHREIATILKLRPLSVRVLLSRARKRLAALIDGIDGGGIQ